MRFREQEDRTNASPGRSPHWKETIALSLDSQLGGLTPASALQSDDNVYISLFDEVYTPATGGRTGVNGSGYDVERRFLGSVTVPFSTIYLTGKIDGFFRLETPDDAGYTAADRVHPNESGYELWAQHIVGEVMAARASAGCVDIASV